MKHFYIRITLLFLIYLLSVFPGYSGKLTAQPVQNSPLKSMIDQAKLMVVNATNHDSVSILLNKADKLAKVADDIHNQIDVLILKGLNEYFSSNYELAMDYYYKALSQAEQTKDSLLSSKINRMNFVN